MGRIPRIFHGFIRKIRSFAARVPGRVFALKIFDFEKAIAEQEMDIVKNKEWAYSMGMCGKWYAA